jgi:hypothetical protein
MFDSPVTKATVRKWEDIDHEGTDSVAGALMGPGTNLDSEVLDALGLGTQME